ncbi:MAG: ABC transporter ATP-binding protein [Candidatus Omnitrophica bacterium]|nr:ABC transporter ATP-binding protein [Candidatus Omnitrophota bacterium]
MLKATNLDKTFRQGTEDIHAVKDVNFRLERGERVYIHGPSGAGKSSFMHVLGGLSSPTKGKIEFEGKDLYRLGDRQRSKVRNKFFGFIFQFYHLLSELNILENVMLPAMIRGGEKAGKIRKRAEGLLETVGMSERLRHRPNQLSGGEAQRTAIARALINSPYALFCDEPTGNLDSEMSEEIYKLLHRISEDNKMSIVLVSHQDVDGGFFDSEYVMRDGVLERTLERHTAR